MMNYDELGAEIRDALGSAYIPAQDETIRAYIQAVKIRDELAADLARTGYTTEGEGSMGQMKHTMNPLFEAWVKTASVAAKLLSDLGLTPKAQKSLPDKDGNKKVSDAAKRRAEKRKGVSQ